MIRAPIIGGSLRDPQLPGNVYERETDTDDGCCDDSRIRLADGTRVETATAADWERVDWQLEFERTIVYAENACLSIPR